MTELGPQAPARRRPSPRPRPETVAEEVLAVADVAGDSVVLTDVAAVDIPAAEVVPPETLDPQVPVLEGTAGSKPDGPTGPRHSAPVVRATPARPPVVRLVVEPRERGTRRGAATGLVVGALVVALAIGFAVGHHSGSSGPSIPAAQREAQSGADKAVVELESYDYRHFGHDLKAALPLATPEFRTFYSYAATSITEPAAVKAHEAVSIKITRTSLLTAATQSYVFLIGAAKVTTHNGKPYATQQVKANVAMQLAGGKWLVSNIVPA
jgi:hypothetical protein